MSFGFGLGFPRARSASLEAAIAALFPDVWYDPSDFTALYQDSAGTTPVTAVEQPVGLMLDKSRGLVLGSELVTNPGPFTATTGWQTSSATPLSVSGGLLLCATSSATDILYAPWLGNPGVNAQNKYFEITVSIAAITGRVRIQIYGSNVTGPWISSTGTYTLRLLQTSANGNVGLNTDQATTVSISSFSVKQVLGAHACHTPGDTTTRPTVSRRINLLTKTEQFDDAAWTKNACSVVGNVMTASGAYGNIIQGFSVPAAQVSTVVRRVVKKGTWSVVEVGLTNGGAYINGAAAMFNIDTGVYVSQRAFGTGYSVASYQITPDTDGYFAITVTVTHPALATQYEWIGLGASAVNGSSILLRNASAVPADLAALPYQRVNTTTDYDSDASKFPTFLRTDGVNDSLQTNAIDFSGTDKMFVGAAVRKLSDAGAGVLAEFSADWNGNIGSFVFLAPSSTGASGNYGSGARGGASVNANQFATSATTLAPVSNVLSSSHDIAGDLTTLRLNGAAQTSATGDKGTGNFGNYKLYLFMRGGTSLPFNGWFFGSLIKGATLSASQIALVERWLASKTKTVVLA